jgi:hypothetical protein
MDAQVDKAANSQQDDEIAKLGMFKRIALDINKSQ